MLVMHMLPGPHGNPVQRRKRRQLITMVCQFLQHDIDDVGKNMPRLSRLIGHGLQPGIAGIVQRSDIQVAAQAGDQCTLGA